MDLSWKNATCIAPFADKILQRSKVQASAPRVGSEIRASDLERNAKHSLQAKVRHLPFLLNPSTHPRVGLGQQHKRQLNLNHVVGSVRDRAPDGRASGDFRGEEHKAFQRQSAILPDRLEPRKAAGPIHSPPPGHAPI